jgi:hypothetical protein
VVYKAQNPIFFFFPLFPNFIGQKEQQQRKIIVEKKKTNKTKQKELYLGTIWKT